MYDTVINNVDILTPTGTIKNGAIVIKEGIIQDILTTTTVLPEAKDVVNGKGLLAAPGFVNTHTHIAMGLFRNYADDLELMDWLQQAIWPIEAKLTSKIVRIGTTLGIAEMFRSGTTTFSDMYFFMDATAEEVKRTGIRAVLSRGLAGVSPTGQQALQENKELFKAYHGYDHHRIKVMVGPHAPYTCPDAYLEQVVALADELGADIHMHLSETKTEVADVKKRTGKTPIAHMNALGLLDRGLVAAHCVHVTEEDMDIMVEKQVRVAHNPQSNLKLASGIAPISEMLERGILVGLGTDGASSNNNVDMLEEIRLAAMLHKARLYNPRTIPALEAWNMGTEMGAKVLGYSDLGLLQKGYRADIVLYDVSGMHWLPRYNDVASMVYSANSSDADTVFVAGNMVMKHKELLTIDEEQLRADMAEVLRSLGVHSIV